ncbi:hypothetical protein RI543_001043 [Arxiozyma heterogenica]|uniref:Altered inheritance of mitochondria protein 24, mitochondrial n=1 Tax=Arxiozyma heterogenica TaxID=278026 RepID=A0AAN7WNQ8_9SACH|nr:hypothetical protein RI543_001043 [Kazachstania heterogenica]
MIGFNLMVKRYLSETNHILEQNVVEKISLGRNISNRFKLLNKSSTLAQITLINKDVPIMIRRGSLLAIHTDITDEDCLTISKEHINPIWNVLKFKSFRSSNFNKIQLTKEYVTSINQMDDFDNCKTPIQLLVSSHEQNNSIYHLNLDGAFDWNVWGSQSILAFEQNTSLELIPSNRILFDKLSSMANFNVLKGRGNVLINGQGTIIKIELKNSYDKLLVNYKNLLAISGKSQIDINNSINNKLLNTSDNFKTVNWQILPAFKWGNYLKYLFISYKNVVNGISYYYNNWKYGYPNEFLEINGPRTILLQSFDTFKNDVLVNYRLDNIFSSHVNNSITTTNNNNNIQKNGDNGKNSIKYWNARIYGDNERIQFTPTDSHFKIMKN